MVEAPKKVVEDRAPGVVAEGHVVVEDRAPGGVAEGPAVVEDRFCLSSRLAEDQAVEVPREADDRPGAAEDQVAEDHAKAEVEAQGVESSEIPRMKRTSMVFAC